MGQQPEENVWQNWIKSIWHQGPKLGILEKFGQNLTELKKKLTCPSSLLEYEAKDSWGVRRPKPGNFVISIVVIIIIIDIIMIIVVFVVVVVVVVVVVLIILLIIMTKVNSPPSLSEWPPSWQLAILSSRGAVAPVCRNFSIWIFNLSLTIFFKFICGKIVISLIFMEQGLGADCQPIYGRVKEDGWSRVSELFCLWQSLHVHLEEPFVWYLVSISILWEGLPFQGDVFAGDIQAWTRDGIKSIKTAWYW